jgi:hypothetical protein
LLIIGYLGVVGGSVAWIVSYWDLNSLESPVYQAAFAIGIGLAGLACWRWTVACRVTHISPTLVRGPTRWMAAASLVLAAVPASNTYQIYNDHRQFLQLSHGSHDYPHYRLLITGGVALTAGLLLASIGFWILGATVRLPTDEAVIDHREGASAS